MSEDFFQRIAEARESMRQLRDDRICKGYGCCTWWVAEGPRHYKETATVLIDGTCSKCGRPRAGTSAARALRNG